MTTNSIVRIGFVLLIFTIGATAFFAFPNNPVEIPAPSKPAVTEFVVGDAPIIAKPVMEVPFPKNTQWTWLRTTNPGGKVAQPGTGKSFVISFDAAGRFTVKGDCNSIAGQYTVWGPGDVSMDNIISTQMYCENSQELDFVNTLSRTTGYKVDGDTLLLDIEGDIAGYGLMTFARLIK